MFRINLSEIRNLQNENNCINATGHGILLYQQITINTYFLNNLNDFCLTNNIIGDPPVNVGDSFSLHQDEMVFLVGELGGGTFEQNNDPIAQFNGEMTSSNTVITGLSVSFDISHCDTKICRMFSQLTECIL